MENYNELKKEVQSFRERIQAWRIPKLLLNKYLFTFFVFAVWMTFFDRNNVFVQIGRLSDLHEANSKQHFYISETKKAAVQLNALMYDQKALEKFAREKYYMKKPDEDVFVIVGK